ncbi:hypothetical protein MN116_008536 [Schistosoma mekongi]|uniref:Uncharacterized protein n=1 Tax=Schistosoma mekongi TaxID=38744 RepID=A0AAE1Z5U4_SCHME|nr:hypothetical protein MN116_008536 [Schistosoma mekongi]
MTFKYIGYCTYSTDLYLYWYFNRMDTFIYIIMILLTLFISAKSDVQKFYDHSSNSTWSYHSNNNNNSDNNIRITDNLIELFPTNDGISQFNNDTSVNSINWTKHDWKLCKR